MRRIKSLILLSIALSLFTATSAHVYAVGTLRIYPTWPDMTSTEETFELWVEGGGKAHHPQLLLVMTETCYDGLTKVEIDFGNDGLDVTLIKAIPPFEDASSATDTFVPDDPLYPGGIRYTVASLKDHLGVDGTDQWIYWALVDFPIGHTINGPTDKYQVKITLDSTNPKMLVYVYGKTVGSETAPYDMKVPPTIPGFMVPEPATIAAVVTPTLTLLAYAYYKRKTS